MDQSQETPSAGTIMHPDHSPPGEQDTQVAAPSAVQEDITTGSTRSESANHKSQPLRSSTSSNLMAREDLTDSPCHSESSNTAFETQQHKQEQPSQQAVLNPTNLPSPPSISSSSSPAAPPPRAPRKRLPDHAPNSVIGDGKVNSNGSMLCRYHDRPLKPCSRTFETILLLRDHLRDDHGEVGLQLTKKEKLELGMDMHGRH